MIKQPKQYKTIEELIEILKGSDYKIDVDNESFAKDFLSKVNYYRLKHYLRPNTTFEKIVSLHEFDSKLRSLLLHVIDHIEITLRARLARIFVKNHNRNPIAYLNEKNFKFKKEQIDKEAAESYCKKINDQCPQGENVPRHQVYTGTDGEMIFRGIQREESQPLLLCQKEEDTNTILVVPIKEKAEQSLRQTQNGEKIQFTINMYKRNLINKLLKKVDNIKKQKFKNKCDEKLPFWVIIEFFTFGDLSRLLYSNLKTKDKKEIAKQFIPEYIPDNFLHEYLESWLRCCTDVRNSCAHFEVLYNSSFSARPRGLKEEYNSISRSLWVLILIIKWLYPFQDKWDKEFIPQMENIVNYYKLEDSDLRHYGFPKTWKEELKKPQEESLYSWISSTAKE